MFTRRRLRALAGTLLMVPLLAFTACEGYEEPGEQMDQEQAGEQPPVQGERPSDARQDDPATAEPGDPAVEETQRREAERPERPAPPTTTEEADERTPETGEAGRDAGAATAGSAATTAMTELSVELPPDLSAGSYEMTCRMEDQPGRQAAGQSETDQDVLLSITVAEGGASATERPGASQAGQPGEAQPGEDTAQTGGDTP